MIRVITFTGAPNNESIIDTTVFIEQVTDTTDIKAGAIYIISSEASTTDFSINEFSTMKSVITKDTEKENMIDSFITTT